MNFPQIRCNDGFTMSVQANGFCYCSPRSDVGPWTAVEVGFPSQREELLMEYAEEPDKPTDTVYGCVPIEVVQKVIDAHGGTNTLGQDVIQTIISA